MKNVNLLYLLLLIFFNNIFSKNLPDKDIIILYTNDVHCSVDGEIGYARLAYYKEQLKENNYVALVDAGDHVQGETIGSITEGKAIIDIMNAVGYDIAVPGNHEFDYGMKQFEYFKDHLECGYISCNFIKIKDNELIVNPYIIKEYGDVKIAFIGITTPEVFTTSSPSSFMDDDGNFIYDFFGDAKGEKFVANVQKYINEVIDKVDYVVVIGHLGENMGITEVWSAPFVVKNTYGIDVFIDGHSHEETPCLKVKNLIGEEVPITQSGSKMKFIGKVTIKTNGNIMTELVGSKQMRGKSDYVEATINNIKNQNNDILSEIIGSTKFDLTMSDSSGVWVIRKQETNLANLVTDSLLYATKPYGGADISIYNGGGIRTNIKKGIITYDNAFSALPFINKACICEISGQSILDVLEMSVRKYPDLNGGFLHVSGLTFAVDPDIKSTVVLDERNFFLNVAGERRVHSVYINNEEISKEKKYKIIGSDYTLLGKGDGQVVNDVSVLNCDVGMTYDLFINYIRELNTIPDRYIEKQNRIIYTNRPENYDIGFNGLDEQYINFFTFFISEKKEYHFYIKNKTHILTDKDYEILNFELNINSTDSNILTATYINDTQNILFTAKQNGTVEIKITGKLNILAFNRIKINKNFNYKAITIKIKEEKKYANSYLITYNFILFLMFLMF